jgi:hypothetical protein
VILGFSAWALGPDTWPWSGKRELWAIANLKTWRILFTYYRRSLGTFASSFRAAIGLYFFKESFA